MCIGPTSLQPSKAYKQLLNSNGSPRKVAWEIGEVMMEHKKKWRIGWDMREMKRVLVGIELYGKRVGYDSWRDGEKTLKEKPQILKSRERDGKRKGLDLE